MKKKTIISCFAIVATFLLFTFSMKLYALDYTISFTGTGASTSVESVVVQNLTKGTTVTVPTGNVLNLTDVATFVDNINTSTEHISVYPNPMQEKSNISFFAKSDGITQINVFSIEGKKIIGVTRNLSQGNRSFQLSMPKGVYIIQIQGNGFSYNAKAISQISSDCKAQIVFSDNENQNTSKPLKSKSAITTMLYTDGDQLLYKGISGNFSTIVTDKPSGNKTTNFDFVECKDADGNYYSVVKIGNQTWMAENLKTTTFKTGESISKVTNNSTWSNATFAAWCDYNDDVTNGIKYGKLYNWYATSDTRKIAPIGWHVPTDAEWTTLTSNLGGESVAGGKLKDLGTINWQTPNTAATNETGFSAFPCGYRSSDGTYGSEGDQGIWWSSIEINTSDAWFRSMNYNLSSVFRNKYPKQWGYSVRCIKDNVPTLSTTAASAITITSVVSGGNFTNDGGATVTERGICWSTTSNPTISDSKTIDSTSTGTFASSLTGLLPNTTYYLRAYATNDAGTGYGNEIFFTTASLQIGTEYAGGIVFYIDETGKHGLVCAPSDQYYGSWGCYGVNVPGVKSTAFGTGSANTALIVATGLPSAAKVCDDLVLNNFDDWYLPSLDELTMMKNNLYKNGKGGFSTIQGGYYWSSSSPLGSDDWNAYYETMMGNPYYSYRNTQMNVRAIRNF